MTPEAEKLLAKAEQSIGAAKRLVADEYADFAVARAYYAMFYAAEALLAQQGRTFRKHGGVHAAFGEHFAKTGLLDPKYHRWLLDAFDKRVKGDYGIEAPTSPDDAFAVIAQAAEFVSAATKHLKTPAD